MIDPTEHPMLLAEPPLNTQQQREKYDLSALKYPLLPLLLYLGVLLIFSNHMLDRAAELMFEKYKVPALFMAKNPVYSLSLGSSFFLIDYYMTFTVMLISSQLLCNQMSNYLHEFGVFGARFSRLLLLGVLLLWLLTGKTLSIKSFSSM
jgi:hypothetical protein